jgi:hypothetical protein
MQSNELLELLYRALRSEHGVAVKCIPSPLVVRQKLYAVRRAQNDPALSPLSFVEGPNDQLWIVKTRKDLPDGTESE